MPFSINKTGKSLAQMFGSENFVIYNPLCELCLDIVIFNRPATYCLYLKWNNVMLAFAKSLKNLINHASYIQIGVVFEYNERYKKIHLK